MPTIINPDSLDFKVNPDTLTDFNFKTLVPRLSGICNSKHLVFDMRQLEPGMYSFPYHFHRIAEELMLIISGSLTLRSAEGFKIINKGELVFFEAGETGVHQFYNHDEVSCVYLDIKTNFGIDIVEYPDSGKVNISPLGMIFEKDTQVNYNKGEENIREIWNKLSND